jgi:hypothetical protein
MNKKLGRTIMGALAFSDDAITSIRELSAFDAKAWQSTFHWLDNSNLALLLLRKIRDENFLDVLPLSVFSRLEQNLVNNRIRVARMADEFRTINSTFGNAGLACPVIKGFSLFPHSCPDPYLRQPSDLDYLVTEENQPAAQNELFKLGYSSRPHVPRGCEYCKGPLRVPSNPEGQYDPRTSFVVELHLDIWDEAEHGILLPSLASRTYRTQICQWEGSVFTALSEEDSFLLQAVHTMRHILDGWTKLSWFYEIGYFLQGMGRDDALWERVKSQCASSKVLRDFVAIVSQLTAQFFKATIPDVVTEWIIQLDRPVRLWTEHYGKQFLFAKVPFHEISLWPTIPCAVILQQEFLPDRRTATRMVKKRLLPRAITTRAALQGARGDPALFLRSQWRRRRKIFYRTLHFLTSGFRYLLEAPYWYWLRKTRELRMGKPQNGVSAHEFG